MSELLDQEIRTLQSLYWSERDPDGLAFAPLADAYLQKGDVKEALDLLTDGMSRQPEYATGHVIATRLYLAQGMHSEAEFAARRVLELDAENIGALFALASVLAERGDTGEAARVGATLLEVDPEAEESKRIADLLPGVAAPDASADEPVKVDPAPGGGAGKDDVFVADASAVVADEVDALGESADTVSVEDDLAVPEATDADADGPSVDVAEIRDPPAASSESEPEVEEMDLGALAPDPEPEVEVMDLGALASDPDPEVEVMDLGALAPDPEPEVETMDLGALAPDPEPEVETMDLGALAPDPEPEVETMDLSALAPDVSELSSEGEPEEIPGRDADEPVYTRTLAELYVRQGFTDRALAVFRHLLAADPGATDIEERIAELGHDGLGVVAEADDGGPENGLHPTETVEEEEEEEVEALARDLADSGDGAHEVDTPFAWTEAEPSTDDPPDDGSEIGDYFDDLLGWESQEGS